MISSVKHKKWDTKSPRVPIGREEGQVSSILAKILNQFKLNLIKASLMYWFWIYDEYLSCSCVWFHSCRSLDYFNPFNNNITK